MEILRAVFVGLTISALLACAATTEFKAFEAEDSVFQGKGGTKVVVNGMEIWDDGDPPRKFKVLGYIEDQRRGGFPMLQFRGDMVKKAREAGGDAIVQLTSRSQITGYYTTDTFMTDPSGNPVTGFDSSMTMPVRRNVAKFAVIKFLE
ncbi:MAG: hypothetical protein Q7K57_04030 [Burkholderiaceae bacterium]|nr:hypothetical protein [Burkholderiaceae bacterium]